jgi:hypothetical protein
LKGFCRDLIRRRFLRRDYAGAGQQTYNYKQEERNSCGANF